VHQLPIDLQQAIGADSETQSNWLDITPLARNEWIYWVDSAKKQETRARRIERACADLKQGKRRPCCWPGCPHRGMSKLIRLYRQAEDYFFGGISTKCLNLNNSAKAYLTQVPVDDLNLVYVAKATDDFDTLLIEGEAFYDQNNQAFVVVIPEDYCTPPLTAILTSRGYHHTDQSVSMSLSLEDYTVDNSESFDGLIVSLNDNLNDWMLPLVGAYESTMEICTSYAATHELALKKNVTLYHYNLFAANKPIVSMTLSMHAALARIDDVSTVPEFQGKGYATRLMTYVLLEAKKLGVAHCFLEASDSGVGVYEKLGFQTLFRNNIYSRKGSECMKTECY